MSRVLKIVLGIEIAVGLLWTVLAAMAHGAGGLAVFGLFLYVYALFAGFFLFAAGVYWTHPGQRKIAGWIMALPILFWFLPLLIRAMSGGVLTGQQFLRASFLLLVAALAICWVAPRKAAIVFPAFLVRSRVFNWLVLLSMIAGWLVLVLVVVYMAGADNPRSSISASGEGLALAIIMAAIYMLWLGIGSLGASTWAWVSLRGGNERTTRKLNFAQVVVAIPGVMLGIAIAIWMAGQGRL